MAVIEDKPKAAEMQPSAEAPSQQTPAAQNAEATPAPQPTALSGRLRRTGGISIKQATTPSQLPQEQPVGPELTDELLKQYWGNMLDAMSKNEELAAIAQMLESKEVRLTGSDMFEIVVTNSYAESQIKPHLVRMLTYMRKKSTRPGLNCSIIVEYEQKETKPYNYHDKYDAMLAQNPHLAKLRIIFPELDY